VTDPDTLHVWYERDLVGHLWRDPANVIGFRYDDNWHERGFPISQSLPLTDAPYQPHDGLAQRFFGNLLPEGNLRDRIVRELKLPDTDFDLLRAIGGECAGALTVLPDDEEPATEPDYEELQEESLHRLILTRGRYYETAAGEKNAARSRKRPRLSLAGAQNKCPVLIRNERYFLPQGESPSTHILKFAVPDWRNVPLYEAFLTLLARNIGLNVVGLELEVIEIEATPHEYLVIPRYDRDGHDGKRVQRLHQEDFCQALGIGRQSKYEEEGAAGANFAKCYRLLRDVSTEPAYDLTQLLRWQIFNYLAGNADGHAKNLSLLYRSTGDVRLAPFYDLVCTQAIAHVDTHLALSIAGERRPGQVRHTHWEQFARELRVRPNYLLGLLKEDTETIRRELPRSLESFRDLYGPCPALQRVEQVVQQQCRLAGREIA
jgi:serine/threonine-protein kinase HipA